MKCHGEKGMITTIVTTTAATTAAATAKKGGESVNMSLLN